jgi:small-conductance mechanosensitive channel
MLNGAIASLPNIVLGLIVFAIFYMLSRAISALVRRFTAGRHRNLGLVLGRLGQWLTLFVGLLIALGVLFPSIDAQTLIEVLGISSVAIGFAFRDILQNFLAGILLLLTEPFRIGDQIVVGSFEGTVDDIQTRATTITTYDGRRVVIPNGALFTGSVIVNTAFDKRRIEYDIGVGYGDDIGRAKALILEALAGMEGVLSEPAPDILLVNLAPSSVKLRARWWIMPPRRADALDMRNEVLTAIKTTLAANGIDLPFPTQQILFHDQTEETDGDRRTQREGWPAGKVPPPQPRSITSALGQIAAGRQNGDGQDQPRTIRGKQ